MGDGEWFSYDMHVARVHCTLKHVKAGEYWIYTKHTKSAVLLHLNMLKRVNIGYTKYTNTSVLL